MSADAPAAPSFVSTMRRRLSRWRRYAARNWRRAVVLLLLVLPLLVEAAFGGYYLWTQGWTWLSGLLWVGSWGLGLLLGWHWGRSNRLWPAANLNPPAVSTEQDQVAWKKVRVRMLAAHTLSLDQLFDPTTYSETAYALSDDLAASYKSDGQNSAAKVSLVEMLALAELISHDLHSSILEYFPLAGRFVTVERVRHALDDWQAAQDITEVTWLLRMILNPALAIPLRVANRGLLGWVQDKLMRAALARVYQQYVRHLGYYLIELHSGRLRVGAQRHRELVSGTAFPLRDEELGAAPVEAGEATIALVGQVKAGKSSVVNGLLGQQQALVDTLPATPAIERHRRPGDAQVQGLTLLDTPGYGRDGPKADQLEATIAAAQESDLLLLVLHARNPAREADLALVRQLWTWFAQRPKLRPPPVIAVLTHVDLLSPMMEWSPPYDWRRPQRTKEQEMAAAVEVVREHFGPYVQAVVPVCASAGRPYGFDEDLWPALAAALSEARVVAVLRQLHAEADRRDTGTAGALLDQLLATGRLMGVRFRRASSSGS